MIEASNALRRSGAFKTSDHVLGRESAPDAVFFLSVFGPVLCNLFWRFAWHSRRDHQFVFANGVW
jgi:hypothetical protein